MDQNLGTEQDTFDRWYAPFASTLNRSEFLEQLDSMGSRLVTVPPAHLPRLDGYIRGRWLTEPRELRGLFSVRPDDVAGIVAEAGDPTAAAGLLSMHPSGHVRQAAVELLGREPSPTALRFLLIRASDWVPQVRLAASGAVKTFLTNHSGADLISALGLVDRLASTSRGSELAGDILNSIARDVPIEALINRLGDPDPIGRRVVAQLLVTSGHALDALEPAIRRADPAALQIIGEAAILEASDEQRDAVLSRLLSARSPALAEKSLWTLLQESPDHEVFAQHALLDRRRRVRAVAIRHLQRAGTDVAAFYRDLLVADPVAGLRGLADCGNAADATVAAERLTDADPRVRRAAVETVSRLDGARYVGQLIELLRDDSVGVAMAAGRRLAELSVPRQDTVRLWKAMNSDGGPHLLRACSRAARGLPRWSRLTLGLRAASSRDVELHAAGIELTDQVATAWNRSFTAPTADESADLIPLIESARSNIGEQRYDALAFAVRPYGLVADVAEAVAAETPTPIADDHAGGTPTGAFQRIRNRIRSLGGQGRRRE